jgi:REP element-mobilizing transposase RayT
MQPDYHRTRHSVSLLYAHLVFVTKYRRRVFNHAMLTDCEDTLREVCTTLDAERWSSTAKPTTYTCSSGTHPCSHSLPWCAG